MPRHQPAPDESDHETAGEDTRTRHVCPFDPPDDRYSSYAKAKVVQHATTWCEHAPIEVTRADVEAILDPDDETTAEQLLAEYDSNHDSKPEPEPVDEQLQEAES
jgi:hypothetical protein